MHGHCVEVDLPVPAFGQTPNTSIPRPCIPSQLDNCAIVLWLACPFNRRIDVQYLGWLTRTFLRSLQAWATTSEAHLYRSPGSCAPWATPRSTISSIVISPSAAASKPYITGSGLEPDTRHWTWTGRSPTQWAPQYKIHSSHQQSHHHEGGTSCLPGQTGA